MVEPYIFLLFCPLPITPMLIIFIRGLTVLIWNRSKWAFKFRSLKSRMGLIMITVFFFSPSLLTCTRRTKKNGGDKDDKAILLVACSYTSRDFTCVQKDSKMLAVFFFNRLIVWGSLEKLNFVTNRISLLFLMLKYLGVVFLESFILVNIIWTCLTQTCKKQPKEI